MANNFKLIRPNLRCSPMVANVAIAIQAEMLLERKTDDIEYIFSECLRIASEKYKGQWKSYEVYFVIDRKNQIIQAFTKSDDYFNGKKPIFTIEKVTPSV